MNDGPDWLRSQLTTFTCPACRHHYAASSIRLLAERDGVFFVDLDCPTCSSRSVAIVTVGMDDAEAAIAEIPAVGDVPDPIEPPPHGLPASPISADDVLDMHQFLAGFRGDLAQVLRASERHAGGIDHR